MHQVLIGLREQRPSNALDMKEKMEVQVTISQGIPWKTLGLQARYVGKRWRLQFPQAICDVQVAPSVGTTRAVRSMCVASTLP